MIKEERKKIIEKEEKEYVRWLFELSNKDIQTAGGKGASLAEMYNKKFPVPPAFIVTAQTYTEFVKDIQPEITKILDSTDINDVKELNENIKKIRALIESQSFSEEMEKQILEAYETLGTEKPINQAGISKDALSILKSTKEPVFVAVRSSATTEDLATASFAGQQESFLGVKGNKQLLEKIKKCFSSLYTARAVYYREKYGFGHSKAALAAVVQKMINSEKSGVMFTSNPMTQSDDIVIEAVYGLGEGIVSGKINPDQYSISRKIEILEKRIADKKKALVRTSSGEIEEIRLKEETSKSQVLTDSEIERIADIGLEIEKHYKSPQDIEFAIESRDIYIVQSRPITTEFKETQKIEGKVILQGLPASPGVGTGKVKIIKNLKDLDRVQKGDVLVTEMTNPDMVVTMQKADAIVTDEGGMTSHAAIVSREMGIPAVVGTKKATEILKENEIITVDGATGKIYEGAVGTEKQQEILPIVNTKTKIKVILDLPDFAERAAKTGAKDIGLLRLEGIIASSGKHPLMFLAENKVKDYSKLLEAGILKIANFFDSIWVRSSDIRTDEFRNLEGAPKYIELNPMLGFHGISFSLKHPELLEAEIQAVRHVAEKHPEKKIGIMFPQIISIEQILEAKKIFNKFKKPNMLIGTMIETPAACEIIDEIADEVDFISLGTNDLTQYTLAVDRGNENIQSLYDEMNPAILSQIARVIKSCQYRNVETSICGQAGSKKEMVQFLVEQGIDSISVNADAAYEISKFVQELEQGREPQKESGETKGEKEEETEQEEEVEEDSKINDNEVPEIEEKEEEIPEINELPEIEQELEQEEKELSKEEKETKKKAEEFPEVEIGFDIFSNQTKEKEAEVENIDDIEDLKDEIKELEQEIEHEKEEIAKENEEDEDAIEIETEKEEESKEEQESEEVPGFESEEEIEEEENEEGNEEDKEGEEQEEDEQSEDKEVSEVIDEMQGKEDDEDIDIQQPEETEKTDEDTLDIF